VKEIAAWVAVITGGASGIGRSTALALARRGVKIVVADIDAEGARLVADAIAAAGGEALDVRCDVGQGDAFEKLKEAALSRFRSVDLVMNNVGVLPRGLPDHIPVEEWERILNINLMSVVRSNASFLPLLLEQGSGHIVNTASFAGLYTYSFDRLPYAAAKAAIVQISEGLALYLKPQGIGVTLLCPGPVATNVTRTQRSFGPAVDMRGPGKQFTLKAADEVGEMVVQAITEDRFMLFTDDQVRELLIERATDWDGFLERQIAHPHVVARA
jgi:NAD(P)-dependent dehydrogenase (short-subunit alcohol dehydrogenase family)